MPKAAPVTIPPQRFIELEGLSLNLKLGKFKGKVLGWGFIKPHWWRNHMHTHSFFEVCYAYQGQGTFHIQGMDYPVEQGQVFVARPGKPHQIVSSGDDPLGIYFWSFTLVPDEETGQLNSRGIDALLDAFVSSPRSVATTSTSMPNVLQMLTEEIACKEPGYPQAVEALVTKLLLDTARLVMETPALPEIIEPVICTRSEVVVQNLVRFLADNYNRPLCLKEIAAQMHLSERQVNRLFSKEMGVTIMKYLSTLRLEAAAQLLLERQLSIKDVAQTTGFSDVRYFMTMFRRHTGYTPGAFRLSKGTKFLSDRNAPILPGGAKTR